MEISSQPATRRIFCEAMPYSLERWQKASLHPVLLNRIELFWESTHWWHHAACIFPSSVREPRPALVSGRTRRKSQLREAPNHERARDRCSARDQPVLARRRHRRIAASSDGKLLATEESSVAAEISQSYHQ